MLQAQVNGYICKRTDDYELLYDILEVTTKDSNTSVEAMNKRKLRKTTKACDNLLCYTDNGDIVGACIYTVGINGIELIHMYVLPEYRVSYGSALINHYLINIIGEGKNIWLRSGDTSSFNKVIEKTNTLEVYTITDRARNGLRKMLTDKIVWKEV